MSETLNLDKCPHCGGVITLDKNSGKLSCEYCGTVYTYEQLRSDFVDLAEGGYDEYTCGHCGAVIVTDILNIVEKCAYCGNTSVLKNRISGSYRPDYIIPFRVTENAAVNTLKSTVRGRTFVKKSFGKELEIKDVSSLFVPFWLYDCEVSVGAKYTTLNDENAKRISYCERYEKVPVDASLRLDDNYMDVLEPFDYADLKPFDKAYMIGHLAERYDTDVKIMAKRADKRLAKTSKTVLAEMLSMNGNSLENKVLNAVSSAAENATKAAVNRTANGNFGNVNFTPDTSFRGAAYLDRITKFKADIKVQKYRYALFPVYLLRCEYRQKNYLFAVNGQTGKVSGRFEIGWLSYILQNLFGVAFGSGLFSAVMFLALQKPLKTLLDMPSLALFGIIFAASFLLVSTLEIKHNARDFLNQTKEFLGQKPLTPNAKKYRVNCVGNVDNPSKK